MARLRKLVSSKDKKANERSPGAKYTAINGYLFPVPDDYASHPTASVANINNAAVAKTKPKLLLSPIVKTEHDVKRESSGSVGVGRNVKKEPNPESALSVCSGSDLDSVTNVWQSPNYPATTPEPSFYINAHPHEISASSVPKEPGTPLTDDMRFKEMSNSMFPDLDDDTVGGYPYPFSPPSSQPPCSMSANKGTTVSDAIDNPWSDWETDHFNASSSYNTSSGHTPHFD